jgi:asparagine synthase (glutamine-hydrolysing)
MCGIAGQVALARDSHVDLEVVPRTAALLAHRGPDDWGYVADARRQVLLLNTRLAIVDVPGGRQPLSNENGRIWVTYNGECYGFDEHRRWLEGRGHRFRTRTDTEVLVHLYEELGERFVERLRGEYAFALHDRDRNVCLLVRDRFGVKPLVFTERAGRLDFASEAKALLADPAAERTLDREFVVHVLGGVFLPDRTVFQGVRQVEPGTYLRIEVGRGWRRERYWSLPLPRRDASPAWAGREADAAEAFADKLREATRLRLHGDVEVGAYLSGGVDSAAVVQAVRETSRPLQTFTVGFDEAGFDESEEAGETARRFGTSHHVCRIGPDDLVEPFPASLWHAETPVVNAHGAAKWLLSRLARSRVRVVLTGEGADELLAGYPQFRHQALLERCARSPRDRDAARALDAFAATATTFAGTVPIRRYPHYDAIRERFGAYPYALTRIYAYQQRIKWLLSPECRRAARATSTLAALEEALGSRALDGLDGLRASQALLIRTELPGYILTVLGDRPEMAHGVEGRVPFLDHELAELICTLPASLLMNGGGTKQVLRRFVGRSASGASVREKRVFLAPSARALGLDRPGSPLAPYLAPGIVGEAGVFSPWAVALLRRVRARAREGSRLQTVTEAALVFALSLSVLHDLFCRDFAGAARRYAPDPTTFDVSAGCVERAVSGVGPAFGVSSSGTRS